MEGLNFDITNYLRLNPIDMLMVCLSTLIIVLVAKHFFWDKVSDYLNRRTQVIQNDLDDATKKAQEATLLKQEYETQMSNVRAEANQIIDAAKDNAAVQKKEILHKAEKQADGIKEKALADIEREKMQAQKEMKTAITDVAFEAAKKIVGKELSENEHKKYMEDFMEHVGDDSWQA